MMASDELTPQQRAALLAWHFAQGYSYTTVEVATLLGVTYQAARILLLNMSAAPIPIYRDIDGRWRAIRGR